MRYKGRKEGLYFSLVSQSSNDLPGDFNPFTAEFPPQNAFFKPFNPIFVLTMLILPKICYKSTFLHCSNILIEIPRKNVQFFTLVHAHKPKFGQSIIIQNAWSYGEINPRCVSCLSEKLTDV